MVPFLSVPNVLDAVVVRGALASALATPDLVIEIPHGATRTVDFTSVEALLRSPLPDALIDFFYVNTDAGAPELAEAIARRFVTQHPARSVAVLRCRIPRTFIDCNRVIDADPAAFREGKVTPGLMPWITDPDDRALLQERYARYAAAARAAAEATEAVGGAMLMLHTYAPRSVDVEVDKDIVRNLRRAYEPAVFDTWPLRPELDVIGRGTDGTPFAPAVVVDRLRSNLAAVGLHAADSETYPMHPSTMAWHLAQKLPGRALCLEVRRDLLAAPFTPFAEMTISPDKAGRIAAPLADALGAWWPAVE